MNAASKKNPVEYQRNALAPGILAAIVCLAGLSLLSHEYYTVVRFIVSILAIIVAWFAVRAGQWWWAPVMVVVAVLWNPMFPFAFTGPWWISAHIVVAAVFIAAGASIKSVRPGTA